MLKEATGMCKRLKAHIENAFWKDARQMAKVWNLRDPRTNQPPHTSRDFINALVALERVEGSTQSEKIVHMVCHHFHHQRDWLSKAVDAWFHEEGIALVNPPSLKRENKHCRGGFGACAREVKSEIVKTLMRNMLSRAGWAMAKKDNSKQGKGKRCEAVSFQDESTLTQHSCCVMTLEDDRKPAAGKKNSGGSVAPGSSAENPIAVDDECIAFGAHVCSHLGVQISNESIQELWSQFKPRQGASVVGSHIDTETNNASEKEEISDLTPNSTAVQDAHQKQPPALSVTVAQDKPTENITAVHTEMHPTVNITDVHAEALASAMSCLTDLVNVVLTCVCLNCFALQSHEKIAAVASTSNSSGVHLTGGDGLVSEQLATVSNTAAQPSMASALMFNVPADADCFFFSRLMMTLADTHSFLLSSPRQ